MTSKSKFWSFIFILISVAITLFPLITHALTFQYSKPITIDHTKVPATLTNFPILVSIANDNDLKNHVTSPSGYDLVFADAAGNLKFQKNNNSCTDVSLLAPNGGENIPPWSILTIQWSCTSPPGVTSQEIRLSTDGGMNFPILIATGLAGELRTYSWNVPSDLSTNQARIRVIVTDGSGVNVFDDSDSDFTIYQAVGRTYVYDELNRLIQVTYEDGRRVTYTYDAAGNRITVTNE